MMLSGAVRKFTRRQEKAVSDADVLRLMQHLCVLGNNPAAFESVLEYLRKECPEAIRPVHVRYMMLLALIACRAA